MSKTIDQRVVEMRFDNAQFERGIAQSMNSINNLKESLDFSGLSNRGINDLTKDIGGISTSVDSIADKFTTFGIIGTTALGKITSAAMDLGMTIKDNLTKNMQEGYDKYNIMMESIQTIMYGTRDQVGEGLRWATQDEQMDYVTSQIEKLNWYTDETSYNLTDMTNNIGKFVAAGVDLDDATNAMMGISSWAAISGQNAETAARAMYNLSQAMAIGKVTVADWMSIEKANMATTEFKHTAADLAFEMGKLYETEEGWYAALDKNGNEVLVSYDGMRQSLSTGWFDNEVLTAVLKKYGDFANDLYDSVNKTGLTATELLRYSDMYKEALDGGEDMTQWVIDLARDDNIYNYTEFGECLEKLTSEYNELGRQAMKAGQECKTFKDAMLATEDAATSAWMGIYTAIFGDYLQSKELWSSVAEEMYDLFVEGIATRRNLLQRWNDIGGRDHLINALWNIWYNIKDVMNAFTDAFAKLFPEKNAVQLLSYAVAFERWTEALRFSSFPWMDDLSNLYDIALNVATAFSHVTNAFKSVGDAAKKAWERIFPKSTTPLGTLESRIIEKILELSEDFEKFTSVLEFTDEQSKKLERTFAGLFAILDIGRMFIATLLEPLTGIKVEVVDIKDPILDVTAAIGDWLVAWRNWIKEHQYFKTLISWIMDFVSKIPAKVEKILNDLFGIGLQDVWEMIKTGAYYAFGAVYMLFTNLPKFAEMATQALFGTDLPTFWENFKGWIKGVWDIAVSFFTGVPLQASEVSKSLFGSGLSGFWEKVVQWVLDAKITIWDFFGGLPGKINMVSKLLFHTDLKTFWDNFVGWVTSVGDAVVKLFSEIIPEKVDDLCKYIFGSDLATIWDNLKKKVTDTGTSVKDFFADIPNKVKRARDAFYSSKLYEFWTKFKITIQDAWKNVKNFFLNFPTYINDLCKKLTGSDLETFWTNLVKNVQTAWVNIRDFFVNLPENADKACRSLFKTDFATFWENTKTNVTGAWESVVYFFTHIPEEADKACQTLFKTDFHTWWENVTKWCSEAATNVKDFFTDLPGKVNWLRDKINELKDSIEKIIKEDIPSELDKISQKLFNKDLKTVANDVVESVGKIKDAFVDFFGIGDEYVEDPMAAYEEKYGKKYDADALPLKSETQFKKSGIQRIKESITDIVDTLAGPFQSFNDFCESDVGKVAKNAAGLAAALAVIYGLFKTGQTIWKIVDSIKSLKKATDVVKSVSPGGNKGFFANFLGGFVNPFKDVIDETSKATKNIGKVAIFQLLATTVLEIAGALFLLSTIRPERLIVSVLALGALFAELAVVFYLITAENSPIGKINTQDLLKVGACFAMLGGAMAEIGAAFWLMKDIGIPEMESAAIALASLFGALFGVIVALNKIPGMDTSKTMSFAVAMDVLAFSLIEIAAAFAIMKDLSADQILVTVFALEMLLGAITGVVIGLTYAGASIAVMKAFGIAVAAIGAGAMMAGVGLWLVADAFEKLASIGPEGVDNIIYGITSFFEVLPQLATKTGEAIVAFCEVINNNSETIKTTVLNMVDVMLSVFEMMIPRLSALLVSGLVGVLTSLEGAMPQIMSFITTFLTDLLTLVQGLTPVIVDTVIMLIKELLRLLLTLTPDITKAAITLLVDTLTQLAENTAEVTSLLIQILLETIVGTIDGLAVEIPRIINSCWNLIIAVINGISDSIETYTPVLKAAIINFKNKISYLFLELFGWDPFADTSDEEVSGFFDFGQNMISSLANGVLKKIDDAREAMSKIANAILDKICEVLGIDRETLDPSKNSFADIAQALIGGFIKKIIPEDVRKKIAEWCTSIIDKLYEALGIDKGNREDNDFAGIATDLIKGFINGIKNATNEAIEAIWGFGDSVVTGLKDVLGIASPSKVFAEMGMYSGEGFARGISDYAYLSEDAASEMAEGSIGAVAGAIATISDMVNDEMDVDPVIKPVLDLSDIAAGTEMMDSMFDNNRSIDLAANSNISSNVSQQASLYSAFEDLKNALNGFKNTKGVTNNNVFNITGDDPRAIANEVSRILQEDVERTGAVWA